MLDYEWGNPSASIMVTSDSIPDLSKPVFHPYGFNPEAHFAGGAVPMNQNPNYQMISATFPDYYHHLNNHVYYKSGPTSYFSQALPLDPASQGPGPGQGQGQGQFVMAEPKIEPGGGYEYNSRIGLNLGGRTYFASAEDEFANRGYLRSRGIEPGSVNCPRCQVEGCGTDLSLAKHYHRRHKVCEFHSKAATVVAAGLTQRFCQQCSRFHLLSEFDNGKRSCRRRLADHNRRRRKSNQSNNSNQDSNVKPQSITKNNSPRHPEILQRPMPPHSSAAQMTVANSPPRIGLDGTSSYSSGGAATSAASRSSLFY